ncbi:hypothetical protein [Halorubrum vacuolatum]|uniref:Envelope protein N-terminal domain-containing protein n=1 Tax=Halorubrum vacuolatum TaxID=63740 RepID=A0A238WRV5_HALVU|nr:hypothetical protein [Halorubrum vacuolatum]SNR49247.1 hypothetical protein SAMN06264855_109128 [Halorubrum vacuolatum]
MQGVGASAGAAIGLAHAHGPVQQADAIAPAVAVGAVGGSAALGWALREFEVVGSDSPAEGLTADALEQSAYETMRARRSNNYSTFIDNKNILDGAEHSAYTEAKIAAIEALNDQESQDDVQDAAVDAVDEYQTTIEKNLLKSWNESVEEFYALYETVDEHDDLGTSSVFRNSFYENPRKPDDTEEYQDEHTYELANGEEFELHYLQITYNPSNNTYTENYWSAIYFHQEDGNNDRQYRYFVKFDRDGSDRVDELEEEGAEGFYLAYYTWKNLIDDIQDAFSNVRDGVITWVDEVYGEVQSGDIDIEELITPREQAEMMAEDEDMAKAIADLQALNIPIDVEREAEIYLPEPDATVRGTLGITQDQSIEAGEEYDPDEDIDGSVYLTYDVSLGEGSWGAYEDEIDGGEVTFTDHPFPDTSFTITTIADESVTVTDDEFTPRDSDGDEYDGVNDEDADHFTIDLSDDLDDAITEIEGVQYFPTDDESNYETIQLSDPFEVVSIETSGGEQVEEMNFESSEPQSDDNYISQEEWDELEEQNQELIDKFNESQEGGGIGGGLPDFGDFDAGMGTIAAGVAVGAGVLIGLREIISLWLPGGR